MDLRAKRYSYSYLLPVVVMISMTAIPLLYVLFKGYLRLVYSRHGLRP